MSNHWTLDGFLKWGIGLLLAIRLLIPTEAAVHGDSLWIVQLWLGLGLLWAWNCYVSGDYGKRFDWLDVMLWVLVAGHVISALSVVATSGDKRAALNMLWEWVGLGISLVLVRQIIRTNSERQKLLTGLVALAVALAGLGIWQHYVSIPQTAEITVGNLEEYSKLTQQMSENSSPGITTSQRNRQRELQGALHGVPLKEPGRTLFLKRLQSSTEPFGFFALANTFAGVLIPMFVVALGLILKQRTRWSTWKTILAMLLILLPLGLCLLLTKSRSAWGGLAVGLTFWGILSLKQGVRFQFKRKLIPGIAIGLGITLLLVVVGLSGGIDREVISEAPKSLKYRIQYWNGALKIIQDRPLLGTGPGNFRQHYLKYKAPEASEEIADPHNLILDVWTSGGAVGVIGLLGICVLGIFSGVKQDRASSIPSPEPETETPPATPKQAARSLSNSSVTGVLIVGIASSFLLLLGINWFFDSFFDPRLVAVLGGWTLVITLFGKTLNSTRLSSACLAGATISILIHLLGAGGIEMPSITQTLLLLIALGTIKQPPEAEKSPNINTVSLVSRTQRKSLLTVLFVGCSCTISFGVCMSTSMLPVLKSKSLVRLGDAVWSEDGNRLRAIGLFRDAAKADPFSTEPVERLAELSFQRWQGRPTASENDFETVVEFSNILIELDPVNSRHYRSLGRKYMKKFKRSEDQSDALAASGLFLQAIQRYPYNSALRSEMADAFDKSGQAQKARREAKFALELDQINRQEGHSDKFLAPKVRSKMEVLQQKGPDRKSGD